MNRAPGSSDVRHFWEAHPLCSFESPHPWGTRAFFEWHDRLRREEIDRFSMDFYEFDRHAAERVLDVGCGIGWLAHRYALGGARIVALDLTWAGASVTRNRLRLFGLAGVVVQGDAERLPFRAEVFDFGAAAGSLHHTPDTRAAVREIHRVLRSGGRAMVSVYRRNLLLSRPVWPLTRLLLRLLVRRVPGRETLGRSDDPNEVVRTYDGDENPVGKAFDDRALRLLLAPFRIDRLEARYVPRRFLSIPLPAPLHRLAERWLGLMSYLSIRKGGDGSRSATSPG